MMARSKLSYKEADKSLECSICFSDFGQPKLLPCLHTFCLKCLKQLCEEETDEGLKPCPLCRREFSIPEGGVDNLPDNNFMIRMISVKKLNEEKKKPSMCDPCAAIGENVEAEAFCKECKQCLCIRCKIYHSVQAFSKFHNIVGVDERPSEDSLLHAKSSYCSVHNGQELVLYCYDCNLLLCYACHFDKHGKHKCKLLEEVMQQKKEVFDKDESRLKECVKKSCAKLEFIQYQRKKTLHDAVDAIQSTEEACYNITKLIASCKYILLNSIETMKANRLKEIESMEDLEQLHNTELDSFLAYSRMVMERGTDCEIIRVADELHKRAEELIKSQDERNKQQLPECSIKFIPASTPIEEDVERLIGQVLDIDKAKGFLNPSAPPKVTSIEIEGEIRGLTVIHNEIFVIVCNILTSSVMVYDSSSGTAKSCINIPDIKKPHCIAGCWYNNALYIGDTEPNCIHRVNLILKTVKCWELKENYYPYSLSVTPEHNVLVTLRISDGKSRIVEYTSEGQLIRDIELGESITYAEYAAKLSDDLFITLQEWRGTFLLGLSVFNSEGQVIKSYGSKDDEDQDFTDNQLSGACSLTVDHNRGHVFVSASGSDKVLVFNKDLDLLGKVQTVNKLEAPHHMYFDSLSGRLFVSVDSGVVFLCSSECHCQVAKWKKFSGDIELENFLSSEPQSSRTSSVDQTSWWGRVFSG